MLDKLFRFPLHDPLHFLGCALLVVGLPLNKVVMSIGTIWLISNVVLEANYSLYWSKIKRNSILILVLLIFGLHLIGVLWSQDLEFAFKDIRTKLPFLTLPLALIVKPLDKRFRLPVLLLFLVTLFITSGINSFQLLSGNVAELGDIRYISRFGSHIRYSLLIVFGFSIGGYFLFFQRNIALKIIGVLSLVWFSYYIMISGVASGLIAWLGVIAAFIIVAISRIRNKLFRYGTIVVSVGILIVLSWKTIQVFSTNFSGYDIENLATHSKSGNEYFHDTTNVMLENGNPIMLYIVEEELRACWNAKSTLDYDGTDNKSQPLKATLIRYLTSLGLRKDFDGCAQLTKEDVSNVEQGITSITAVEGGLNARIDELKTEIYNYKMGNSPSGNSMLQRIEYWKVATYIIRNNFLFGVGTGDVQKEFNKGYEAIKSPLESAYRNRTHNQFLAMWVAFGLFGFILFILLWVLVFKSSIQNRNILGLTFAVISILSFLPEDTLETQQGVTFVSFFLGFIPWWTKKNEKWL